MQNETNRRRLILIDGHAIIHRAFHAYPLLTTSKGELINAVYGFTSILLTVLRELGPKYVAVAFDLPKPTFRHKKFEGYKATRPETPKELTDQIERVHQVVETLNIPIFEVEGYEADDVIGTLAVQAGKCEVRNGKWDVEMRSGINEDKSGKSKNQKITLQQSKTSHFTPLTSKLEVIIVTGDRDALQLVDNQVKVYLPAKGKKPAEVVGKEKFLKKYRFEPRQLVDYKALVGDPSDNIPGVSGIGPKTATDLILQFENLKAIYKNLSKIPIPVKDKLTKDRDQAFMSYELARIETKVPINLDLKKCRLSDYNKEKVLKLFEELEFRSLIVRLPDDGWEEMVRNTIGAEENEKLTTRKTKERAEKENKQMELF